MKVSVYTPQDEKKTDKKWKTSLLKSGAFDNDIALNMRKNH